MDVRRIRTSKRRKEEKQAVRNQVCVLKVLQIDSMMYFITKLIMNTAKTKLRINIDLSFVYFLLNQIKNEQNVKI